MLKRNEKLIKHKLWQYLLPGIMLTAALQVGNIVDTMLVGNIIGSDAMSAVKIGMTIDNIMEIPGYVLGVGGSVAVGILLGKREMEKANRVFSTTFAFSLICGFIFAVLSVTSPFLADMLTGGNSLAPDVSRFVFVTLLGAPVLSLALQFMNYVAVDNNPSVASAYVICANVINLVFDYLLLKYTSLGTAGAALSTILGYGLGMLVLLKYLKSDKRMLRLVNPFTGFKEAFLLAAATGVPTLLFMVFMTIKDAALNTMIVRIIGNDAMAAYTVCTNVTLLVELLVGGIIGTVASIGSVIYGEQDYFGVRTLIKHVTVYGYAVLTALLVVLYAFTGQVVALFGIRSGELAVTAVAALRIFIVCLPFYLFNKLMVTYYQSTEKTKLSGLITSLQNCVAVLPAVFATVFIAKATGRDMLNALMLAFILSELITILAAFLCRKLKYKDGDFLLLPKDDDVVCLDISIGSNIDEAELIPREIRKFCEENGVDPSKANMIAVAAEEMAVNIISYGGKKATSVDINLSLQDGQLILRTRDNGLPFDPTEYEYESRDYEIHGIELVKKLTDQIQYMRVLDFNNTVISIDL